MRAFLHRLFVNETTINFHGTRRVAFVVSLLLVLGGAGSLIVQGLNLGIDFTGGVSFEVPATGALDTGRAGEILEEQGMDSSGAKIQILSSSEGDRVRIQVETEPDATVAAVRTALADAAGVDETEVSQSSVSATWGRSITWQAVRALLVFLAIVMVFIAWRFEWAMALAAIVAVLHDVVLSVGVYSVLGLEVTPATVVAFLTILGFSLYDTIVVFDRVQENVERFSGSRVSYADIVNVSMNEVLMRSLNTSVAAVLPVLSLLVLGSWVMGAVALEEFAIALIVGMVTGVYSSIFLAAPILAVIRERRADYASMRGQVSLGPDMATLMLTGTPVSRRAHERAEHRRHDGATAASAVEALLSHPPRPRKKGRR
jgi:preprotein translocase subunit SecF